MATNKYDTRLFLPNQCFWQRISLSAVDPKIESVFVCCQFGWAMLLLLLLFRMKLDEIKQKKRKVNRKIF